MITPDMPANMAVKEIMAQQLEKIKFYAERLPSDSDIEDLHKFRVGIRRTRAGLNQLGGFFYPPSVKGFKKDFSFITKFSNELRDLDVFLAKEKYYKSLLPIIYKNDIEKVFAYLKEQRDIKSEDVIRRISNNKNNRFVNVIRRWEQFLLNRKTDMTTPIIEVARKKIWKQYKKVVNKDTKDLHAVRMEFKKLRYLMEFFKSILPVYMHIYNQNSSAGFPSSLIKQIKRIQDDLGVFNDCIVHQLILSEAAKELEQYFSTGSIIGILQKEKELAVESFYNRYKIFIAKFTKQNYKKLTRKKGD